MEPDGGKLLTESLSVVRTQLQQLKRCLVSPFPSSAAPRPRGQRVDQTWTAGEASGGWGARRRVIITPPEGCSAGGPRGTRGLDGSGSADSLPVNRTRIC